MDRACHAILPLGETPSARTAVGIQVLYRQVSYFLHFFDRKKFVPVLIIAAGGDSGCFQATGEGRRIGVLAMLAQDKRH
jgi:hypothetical protein